MNHTEYWERIGKDWEKTTGNFPGEHNHTHFQQWKQLDKTWGFVLSGPRDFYIQEHERWNAFAGACASHATCQVAARCGGCGYGHCEHLASEYLCLTYPVCAACDMLRHPNPWNPRNKWIVKHYVYDIGVPSEIAALINDFSADHPFLIRCDSPNIKIPIAMDQPEPEISQGVCVAFPKEWGWD
jgi:hypothetical protein